MTEYSLQDILDVPDAERYLRVVQRRLPEKTARHSVSTAIWMGTIAEGLGHDRDSFVVAGLLHDIGKKYKGPALLARAQLYGLPLTDLQRSKPKLLHGPVAAEECVRDLGVHDEAVYEAIYWHTTGRPELGTVGLVLYYADFSEPLRERDEAAQARKVLEQEGFWTALCFVADRKLAYVRLKPPVDPMSEAFHSWLSETVPGNAGG